MVEWMVAAPASGCGKTVAATAMLAALRRRGLAAAAFKCGPDYIDPGFHRAAQGTRGCNLDLFLSGPDTVRGLYAHYTAGCGAAVVEGAMGFYDGLGGSSEASAWHLAHTLGLPVLLVVSPKGQSLTLAALLRGLQAFRPQSHIRAVLFNNIPPRLAGHLAPLVQRETGLPVLGCLPPLPEAGLPSRHLGLCQAAELPGLAARLESWGKAFEAAVDMPQLLALGRRQPPAMAPGAPCFAAAAPVPGAPGIAVARDEAFSFCYEESLAALQAAGARLCFFSPLHDAALPAGIAGLYLPGGYPERYARALAANQAMRAAVRGAVAAGLPTVAECGGFLYLGQSLQGEEGGCWPMAGVLPGTAARQPHLVRFGYAMLCAQQDSLLFAKGEQVPVHEFHYWDSSANGEAFAFTKPGSGRSWRGGWATQSLYAGFAHLYFAGRPQLAARFVQAAACYQQNTNGKI